MSKETLRNPLDQKEEVTSPINGVVEEIKDQDLDEKAGAGLISTALRLTIAGKCGAVPTYSYECTHPHRSCA
ncbi:salivaricin M family lantibiotic [Anaerosacchariphilus polymeriproducens]|uniref:Plantaricin C family lantibiotic n=1 Tax=Anaerosacchariphilus polymeriproducens TaxID=1812858 RepID=A0A371AYR9_9FIRM|nr:salivaricin M family lantibiotic [Anaerosacchariphilus polymeriproducens]RDU24642.1 plantaricin C family lantibiotic [Anaerosacchariphilus polymeriproducens]